jgi:orotate phosphoribosyltransferase
MSETRERLLRLLRERAYREGTFELSSGRQSTFYVDSKTVTLAPDGIPLVGEAFYDIIRPYRVSAVGGLTLGADPIVTAIAAHSGHVGEPIPAFIVRKEPKSHGTRKWIEGPVLPPNARVAIVDDVLTTGGSALKAAEAVRAEGGEVAVIVGLLDREEGARERVEALGYPFQAVFRLSELRARRDH